MNTQESTYKPGQLWYSLYQTAEECAHEMRQKENDPLTVAQLALIDLADWRWLQRTNLRVARKPDREWRKDNLRLWDSPLRDGNRPFRERLILSEAVLWSIASISNFDNLPPDQDQKHQLETVVSLVTEVLSTDPDWPELLLTLRLLSHHGKSADLGRLQIAFPVNHVCQHLRDFITKWGQSGESKYIYDGPRHDRRTPEATVTAAESVALAINLANNESQERGQDFRELGRNYLKKPFARVLSSEWFKKEQREVPHWMAPFYTKWWLATVGMQWYLADWVVFDPSWEQVLDEMRVFLNKERVCSLDLAAQLRAVAEGCLSFADAEPQRFMIDSRRFKLALRGIICDDEIARRVGDRLMESYFQVAGTVVAHHLEE
jgi:hypothetical protein